MRAILTARGIQVPSGAAADPAGAWTVQRAGSMQEPDPRLRRRGRRACLPGTGDLLQRLSEAMLRIARRKNRALNVHFQEADAARLPFDWTA